MPMSISDIELHISVLNREMERQKNAKIALSMAAYLKNRFVCYGIKSPVRNAIQKAWFETLKDANLNRWDVIMQLYSLDQREYHYVAIDYLNRTPKKDIQKDDYKALEELVTTHAWWDSVDNIASNYVGKYFKKFPEMIPEVIGTWQKSKNMWLNRTCLIFQLKYGADTDFQLLKKLIRRYQQHQEFFIQKAIGWSLRQYSKYDPEAVLEFILAIELKGLAFREASKYLGPRL